MSRDLRGDEWWERRWALKRAYQLKDHKALIEGLEDPHLELRRIAARYLGRLRSRPAREALERRLADEDRFVRSASVRALGRIRMSESVPRLLEAAESDRVVFVRTWAIESLREIDDTSAVPGLIRLLDDDELRVRMCAIVALRRLRDRRALPALRRHARSDSLFARLACWRAVAQLHVLHRGPATG